MPTTSDTDAPAVSVSHSGHGKQVTDVSDSTVFQDSPAHVNSTAGNASPIIDRVEGDAIFNVGSGNDELEAMKLSPEEHYRLAMRMYKGDGVIKDFDAARNHCEHAAKNNYLPAINLLALWHWRGDVLPQNSTEAERLWKRSASSGNSMAYWYLGSMLESSFQGVTAHYGEYGRFEALNYYVEGAKSGNELCKQQLKKPWSSTVFELLEEKYPKNYAFLKTYRASLQVAK